MADLTDSFEYLQLEAALLLSGVSSETVQDTCRIIREISSGPRGYQRVGKTLKSWKSATVAILARLQPSPDEDSCEIPHSRILRRSLHLLRRSGLSPDEISSAVELHGRRRIPPFFLDPALVRCLIPDPSYDVVRKAVPLANLSRAGPVGGEQEVLSSLSGFQENVTRVPDWSFDLTGSVERMLRSHRFRGSKSSRWEATSRASKDFPRSEGGKVEDFIENYVNRFRYLPVSAFITETGGDLFDLTGSIVLRDGTYSLDDRFCDVAYPDVGPTETDLLVDSRIGHLGLFWALWELRALEDVEFDADETFPNLGRGYKPSLRVVRGSIDSRVSPVPEAGLKVRVITITAFFVALIGSVARHSVDDPLIEMDPFIRIGLKSKVKLYDFLVKLNSGHRGVADTVRNRICYDLAVSVDLTTSTDTPDLGTVSSLLRGVSAAISGDPCYNFFQLAVDVAVLPRQFLMPDGSTIRNHKCGIMMGEGLSGIFLNIASAYIRYSIHECIRSFPDYAGSTVEDADFFISNNVERIQTFLDGLTFTDPCTSVQSGDDMSSLSFRSLSGHLILMYRVMNFVPSSAWYESAYFLTFTEEVALNTSDSNGWTFVDTVKPRLFRPLDASGERAVASRIKQIGDSLRYLSDDSVSSVLIPLVDRMLDSCPSLSRVVRKCGIPVGLPTWLGGLGHPAGDDPGYVLTLAQKYRDLVLFLSECEDSVAAEVFITGNEDYEGNLEARQQVLTVVAAMLSGDELVSGIPEGTQWISVESLPVSRLPGEKHSVFLSRRMAFCESNGLVDLDTFCVWLKSTNQVVGRLSGEETPDIPIARQLRMRQEFLFSLLPDSYLGLSDITDEDIFTVYKKLRKQIESRLWHKKSLMQELGLETQPVFSVSFRR